jgi:hypothetical protein
MVVGDNESATMKNAGESLAILIAMQMRRGTMQGASPDGAHPGLHSKPLDAGQTEHYGDDVCGGSCVDARQISCTIPTVGNLWGGSFSFPPVPIGVKLFNTDA